VKLHTPQEGRYTTATPRSTDGAAHGRNAALHGAAVRLKAERRLPAPGCACASGCDCAGGWLLDTC
jgi:hypothetical protein